MEAESTEYKRSPRVSSEEFREEWNKLGKPFSGIRVWTKVKDSLLDEANKHPEFRSNWKELVKTLKLIPFCRGEEEGSSWVANMEWFLGARKTKDPGWVKVLEGANRFKPLAVREDILQDFFGGELDDVQGNP